MCDCLSKPRLVESDGINPENNFGRSVEPDVERGDSVKSMTAAEKSFKLEEIIRRDDITEIKQIMEDNPEFIYYRDEKGISALEYSIMYGNIDIVEQIFYELSDNELNEDNGHKLLHLIAKYYTRRKYIADPPGFTTTESRFSTIIHKLILLGVKVDCPNFKSKRPSAEPDEVSDNDNVLRITIPSLMCETPLIHSACEHSSHHLLGVLLNFKADITVLDNDKNNIFHIAALKGNVETFILLVESCLCLLETEHKNLQDLYLELKKIKRAKGLQIARVFTNCRIAYSTTRYFDPYFKKIESQNRVVQTKLDEDAENCSFYLHSPNKDQKTPLTYAVWGNCAPIVGAILLYNPEITDKERHLTLYAASKGYLEVLDFLLAFPEFQAPIKPKRIPLHPIQDAAKAGQLEVVKYLIKKEPKCIEMVDEHGKTPLLLAVGFGRLTVVKYLIEIGANVEAEDKKHDNIILLAVRYQRRKVLAYLLQELQSGERKVHPRTFHHLVNQFDHHHRTAVHIASEYGCKYTVQKLCEAGAELDAKDLKGWNALHVAANAGKTEVGHDETVRLLIYAKAAINADNGKNQTPLYSAVKGGRLSTVKLLLSNNAHPYIDGDRTNGNMCLHKAAKKGYKEIVEALIGTEPVDVDDRDAEGRTALDIAIYRNQRSVVEYLLGRDDWQVLMKSKQRIPTDDRTIQRDTPFRQLMKHFPDLALVVLNNSNMLDPPESLMIEEEIAKQHQLESGYKKKHEVHHVFQWIDDTYMMMTEDGVLTDEASPYYDHEQNLDIKYRLRDGAVEYHKNYDVICEEHPLQIMVNLELTELLFHPVTQSLIEQKWNMLGKWVFGFGFGFYLIFLLLYTFFVTQATAPYERDSPATINGTDTAVNLTLSNIRKSQECLMEHEVFPHMGTLKNCIIFFAIAELIKEGVQLFYRRLSYFNLENAIECFVFFGSIYTVIDIDHCAPINAVRTESQWTIMALCVFAAWINLIQLLRQHPNFGIYVVMFLDVLRTFTKSSFILGLFVTAFSSAFFVLMKNRKEFASLPLSLLKTTAMMIGELDFGTIFHGDQNDYAERLYKYEFTSLFFVVFCVIMTIMLINLLIGLAVDDIKLVREKASFKRMSMQVKLVLEIEAPIPCFRRMMARSRKIFRDEKEIKKNKEEMEVKDKETDIQRLLRSFEELKTENKTMAAQLLDLSKSLKHQRDTRRIQKLNTDKTQTGEKEPVLTEDL